jgi:SRSO17 transposase
MLPECRTECIPFPIPKFSMDKRDIDGFMDKLKTYHEQFRDCFSRSEPWENLFRYLSGQFSGLERKSIEPMALHVEGGDVRCMQRFISDAVWDDDKILKRHHENISEEMGDKDGVLIFDESGFVKKGDDSAGVSRQYCGSIGKVENCQVGVFAAYASRHGYTLIDDQLFIPQKWFEDIHKERREKCRFPKDLSFKTKPQIAAEMFQRIRNDQILPFKYVAADSVYTNSEDFLEAVENIPAVVYFLAIPSDTLFWFHEPVLTEKQFKYKGVIRSRMVVNKKEKVPVRVDNFAKDLKDYFWYRRTVAEGTKGPNDYEFTKRRVTLCKKGMPDRNVWLIIRRTLGENPEYSFFISNAPRSTKLSTFVWLSGIRWAIEQCFEETKTELGMDHYEVRKYGGWHHHILSCMLAHFFLWHLKIRLGGKITSHYAVAA